MRWDLCLQLDFFFCIIDALSVRHAGLSSLPRIGFARSYAESRSGLGRWAGGGMLPDDRKPELESEESDDETSTETSLPEVWPISCLINCLINVSVHFYTFDFWSYIIDGWSTSRYNWYKAHSGIKIIVLHKLFSVKARIAEVYRRI